MEILLVDDEQLQLTRLEGEVKKVLGDVVIHSYLNPLKALEDIEDKNIDIAFLDVEMPGMNGLELGKELKRINPLINIIFVTAYDSYALDAYKIHASGYITKPVNGDKIAEEIEFLRNPIEMKSNNKLQFKCFGNFEVFYEGKPVKFQRLKSKELLAYLIYKDGAVVTNKELCSILWEEDRPSYLRNLVADIQLAFRNLEINNVFYKVHDGCYLDISHLECDAYEFKKNNPDAIRKYRGEYMIQYPWANFIIGD